MSSTNITFEDSKSEQYRAIYITGFFGGMNLGDTQIIFYLDRLEPETSNNPPGSMKLKKIKRELQVEVHMTHLQFKALSEWMKKHVDEYEKKLGSITLKPQKTGDKDSGSMYT